MIELVLASIAVFQDPTPPDDPLPQPAPEEPAEEEAQDAPPAVVEPPQAPPLDLSPPEDPALLVGLLRGVAERYPDLASVEVLAVDGAGREIAMLVLGDHTRGDPARRPALALYSWVAGGRGEATALALVDDLLQGPPDHAALLKTATVYVIPALHLQRSEPGQRLVDWSRNFPIGWQPASVAPRSGDVPLSEPETRALAGFLQSHSNLSLLVEAGLAAGSSEEVPELLGDPDRAAWERLFAARDGPSPKLRAPGLLPGDPATFAWNAYGVFPACLPLLPPRDGASVEARAALLRDALRILREAAMRLPHISLGEPRVEVLRPGLLRLDLSVSNAGLLPTLSGIGTDRALEGEVTLSVEGGAVLACASGPSADVLAVERGREGRYEVGQIPGGGSLELCLLIETDPGAELTLTCESPRAGTSVRTFTVE